MIQSLAASISRTCRFVHLIFVNLFYAMTAFEPRLASSVYPRFETGGDVRKSVKNVWESRPNSETTSIAFIANKVLCYNRLLIERFRREVCNRHQRQMIYAFHGALNMKNSVVGFKVVQSCSDLTSEITTNPEIPKKWLREKFHSDRSYYDEGNWNNVKHSNELFLFAVLK
jgi:hypothetical protein